jgi:hypothetical protein
MHWPEVSLDQYEKVRREVDWEGNVPQGAKFHVAWMAPDGFHVVDVWNSAQEFQRFVDERLMPGVQKVGIQGEPRIELAETHAIFAPDIVTHPALA